MVKIRCFFLGSTPDDKGLLKEVPMETKVSSIKSALSEKLKLSATQKLEVIYSGRRLSDETSLESVAGLKDDHTIHVLKRKEREKSDGGGEVDGSGIESLVTSFQTALADHHHRILLFKIISNPESLNSLLSANPGLKEDTFAQSILKDPLLFMHILTSDKTKEVIEAHPCVIEAGQQILSSLHQEVAAAGNSGLPVLEPSEDEGEQSEGEQDEPQENQNRNRNNRPGPSNTTNFMGQRVPGSVITTDQLAAALARAGGAGPGTSNVNQRIPAQPNPTQLPNPSGGSGSGSGGITAEAVQQALLNAFSGLNPPPQPQPPSNPSNVQPSEDDLNYLRSMGFTDDTENRNALFTANGNVQEAVEIIISNREKMEEEMGLD